MKECIIILGMHRSGTSVLTGITSILGCYTGFDLMKPTQDNPKGYFENNKIYQLNRKILQENKSDWDDYNFTIKDVNIKKQQAYIEEAKLAIQEELNYVNKIVIKDPRLCLLLPIWEQALQQLDIKIKIIFSYRNPLEVAYSLKHRDKLPLEKGLILWTHYFFQAEYYSRNRERIVIKYNDDFMDMDNLLNILGDFIGIKVTNDIVLKSNDFYSPSLKHHSLDENNISNELPSYLKDIVSLLKKKQLDNKELIDQLGNKFYNDKTYYLYNEKSHKKEIHNYKESIVEITKKIAEKNKLLEEKERELEGKERELERKERELDNKKNKISDLENKIVREKNNYLRQKLKLDKKINELNSRSKTAEDIFNSILSKKKIRKKIKQSSTNGKLPLRIKNWRYTFSKLSAKKLIRHKHLIINSGFFSPYYYLTSYPDVWKAKMDPLDHFCRFGWKENRNPSHLFNTKAYLTKNIDVAQANINPLIHYLVDGKKEGRLPNPITGNEGRTQFKRKSFEHHNHLSLFGPIFKDRWLKSSIVKTLSKKNNLLGSHIDKKIMTQAQSLIKQSKLKVSVIMPTWNRENIIALAIDSALTQSYPIFELIISDDGSSDNTISFIKNKYTNEITSGKIKIITNQHQGVSAARNAALEKATGDLIAYLDSDNQWKKDFLLLMVATFEELDELNCAYAALKSYDADKDKVVIRGTPYNRKQLLHSNFIDLNIFMHRRVVYQQLGGFDTELERLVDWELIIRYTKNYQPAYLPFIGVDYYLDNKKFANITTTISLDNNLQRVYYNHFQERVRYGLEALRIAYVLWDFPALSQTFVLLEIKELIEKGYDIKVYYSVHPDKAAILDFSVDAKQVNDANALAELLIKDERNLCHSHFAYPTVTLLTYPACLQTHIPFTFMPHAVDIFHQENKKRNKIAEISRHPLCLKIFVHGRFHKNFIESCGVASEKIAFNFQAVNIKDFSQPLKKLDNSTIFRGIVVSRFVEKKGIKSLIDAAFLLKDEPIIFDIYGYGPLEDDYKQQIKQLKLDNIHLKGGLTSQQAVATAYQGADFLIAPCVVADNGDMDGFPTVILEAMAMELPVITTDIAAIPDYLTDHQEALIVPANQPKALATAVRELQTMPDARKQALIEKAKVFLKQKIGVQHTLQRLLDTWQSYSIEIFLVTFNTAEYEDRYETFEIIRRIFTYTTTPFTLTIIDNQSDLDFWQEIIELTKNKTNVRLIRKQENQYCGPASNIALELSDSEYAIYLCSKEAFIKDHGWERVLINYMRTHPDKIIAGHASYLPQYIYGHEYQQFPEFSKFRNKDYAKKYPDKVFSHIQGGIYIIKREFIAKYGGFNLLTPHGAMDIEFSYYIESLGFSLGVIPEIVSITTKTLPEITTRLTEKTIVAHPLTYKTAKEKLDILNTKGHGCNICGWQGKHFNAVKNKMICPNCNSTGLDRNILKYLAANHHIYRKETLLTLGISKVLEKQLSVLFNLIAMEDNIDNFRNSLKNAKDKINYFILDFDLIDASQQMILWDEVFNKLASKGEIVFISSETLNIQSKSIKQSSQYFAYDWRNLNIFTK